MKTIEISPVGAFRIALITTHWNKSTEMDLKNSIREGLLSGHADQIQKALQEMNTLLTRQYYTCGVVSEYSNLNTNLINVLSVSSVKPFNPHYDQKLANQLEDKARADVAFYFATMFQQDYFETIPLPIFNYVLDADLVLERRILSPDEKISVRGPC